ncbi:MAG TPA: hypothetical protein VNE21_05485, partial [Mycobacteriales bacterium]|nr:hypothetical protein [Mycobacteriales bacterium]
SVWGAGDVEPDGIMEAGIVVLGDCPCTLPPVADLLVDGHTGRLLQNNFSYFPMYLSVRPPGDDFLDASYRPEGSYHPQQFFLAVRDGHHFRPIWQRVQPLTDKVSAWAAFFVGPVPGANTIPFIGSCVARQGQGRDCLWLDARTGRPVYRDLLPLTAP